MKKAFLTSCFIIALVMLTIIGIFFYLTKYNKPFSVKEYDAENYKFISGNFSVSFVYPKSFLKPTVNYPNPFGGESIDFPNGFRVSIGRVEGFFGPYLSSIKLVSNSGNSCLLHTLFDEFNGASQSLFGECFAGKSNDDTESSIIKFHFPGEAETSYEAKFQQFKDIIESVKYSNKVKFLNL